MSTETRKPRDPLQTVITVDSQHDPRCMINRSSSTWCTCRRREAGS